MILGQVRACGWRISAGRGLTLFLGLWSVACAACGRPSPTVHPARDTPAEFFGWVLREVDSAGQKVPRPAAGAKVWTEPESDAVTTKEDGYWSISTGLVPGPYRVVAEFEGITGRTQRVTARLGRSDTVMVMIGGSETPWPPPLAFINMIPKGTRGPAVIR